MHHTIKILSQIFVFSTMRYFVIAGVAFLLCYVVLQRWLKNNKIQSRRAERSHFIREILLSMQTTAVFTVIAYCILYTPFTKYTQVYPHLSDHAAWWLPVSVVICLIIHDTYFYWLHRLMHHPAIFKYAHLEHHKSTNPSPWASYSFHFIEAWTEGAVLLVIVFIMPVHAITIALFTVSAFIINVYGHLGYEIVPQRFRRSPLFQFFNTSVHHNLHHSKFKGNYGLYFRVWDRLMGTEHPDYVQEFDRVQQNRFGHQIKLSEPVEMG